MLKKQYGLYASNLHSVLIMVQHVYIDLESRVWFSMLLNNNVFYSSPSPSQGLSVICFENIVSVSPGEFENWKMEAILSTTRNVNVSLNSSTCYFSETFE